MPATSEEIEKLFSPQSAQQKLERKHRRDRDAVKGFDSDDELSSSAYAMSMYRNEDVLQMLGSVRKQKDSQEVLTCLRNMQMKGGLVHLVAQPEGYEVLLARLEEKYPHFRNVTDFIKNRMRLNALKEYPVLNFGASLLLNGPAGCGKSSFLIELAECFDTKFLSIQCAAATCSADLTGLSGSWGNGRSGKVFDILVNKRCPSPIILLDELDKVGHNKERHNFTGALYGLLEKNNAKKFTDEFVDVELNASMINWFSTSNDTSAMDSAILDRFKVLQVTAPTQQDLMKIIPQIFRQTVFEMELQEMFETHLNASVIKSLATQSNISIRRIKSSLETALANAAIRVEKDGQKVSLIADDLPTDSFEPVKQKMGFIH